MELDRQEETIDLLELLEVLKQHIILIVLSTLAAAALGFVATFFLATPKFEASALMIVNTRQDVNATVTSDQINSATRLVDTYSIIIKSDTVLQKVIDNLGLSYDYEQLDRIVSVTAVDETQVMRVTVTDPDIELARRVCEQITLVAPDVIVEAVEAGSVKVISQALPNPEAVSPHVMRDTVIMAVLGMIASIGLILVRQMLNNKINSESDVSKYLELPVLGVIPKYEEGK